MFHFRSIFARLIFLHTIALVLIAVFLPLALYELLNSATNDLLNRAMQDHAMTLAAHLVATPDGKWALTLPPDVQGLYSEAYGRYAYSIIDKSGQVVFSSRSNHSAIFPNDPRVSDGAVLETKYGAAAISGVSVPRTINGQQFWIQTGEDLAHRDVLIDDIVADFFKRVGWIVVPMLMTLLAIDILIFRRALRPLTQASEKAQQISPARTSIRLPMENIPNDIAPLVLAVNQALDRLERGFQAQRDFTADAAHELRTPLTILRTRVDMLADRDLARILDRDIDGMSRIVSQLLDMAELESFVVDPSDRADLRSTCLDVAEFIAPWALAQGKNIAVLSSSDDPIWIRGNAELIFRAVRNLTENAVKHTAPGTSVEITAGEGEIRVYDQGPGIALADRSNIFKRFWRSDRSQSGGAGLGLSIVRRIMQSHSGDVTAEDRSGGGAIFVLRFEEGVLKS